VRARLKDGRFGQLVGLVGQHTTSTGAFIASDNWRADPGEAPAGAVTAVGVHLLDHMIEFAGKVRTVHCLTERCGSGASDDTTTILMQFDRGVTGVIFCSVATATHFSFTIYGSTGLAEISGPHLQTLRCVPASTRAPDGPVTAPPAEITDHSGFDMLNAELTEFARCIRENRTYPVSIDEVLHGMSVFDALVESAKSKRIIAIAEPEAVLA
jgi:predicted dehydrogenase